MLTVYKFVQKSYLFHTKIVQLNIQDKKRYPTVELFLPKSWLDLEDEVKALKAKNPVPVIPLSQLINIAQSNVSNLIHSTVIFNERFVWFCFLNL